MLLWATMFDKASGLFYFFINKTAKYSNKAANLSQNEQCEDSCSPFHSLSGSTFLLITHIVFIFDFET